jgi:type II secretory pathway pseudopilin PulG
MRRSMGFTLVELLIVIVFISIALVGIAGLFANSVASMDASEDQQKIAQYLQECGERVIGVRRDLGFDSTSFASTMCDAYTLPSGFSRSVTVGTAYAGTSTTPCPDGASCKDITITISKGTLSASSTVMLVSY